MSTEALENAPYPHTGGYTWVSVLHPPYQLSRERPLYNCKKHKSQSCLSAQRANVCSLSAIPLSTEQMMIFISEYLNTPAPSATAAAAVGGRGVRRVCRGDVERGLQANEAAPQASSRSSPLRRWHDGACCGVRGGTSFLLRDDGDRRGDRRGDEVPLRTPPPSSPSLPLLCTCSPWW